MRQFIIDRSTPVPSCFPADLDTGGFIDITTIDAEWRQFFDPKTGKTHNCADYFAMARRADLQSGADNER